MSTTTLAGSVTQIRAVDWIGQKRAVINSRTLTVDTTVGELAEVIREKMQLPRGSYAVYLRSQKLDRSATLEEAGVEQDDELELNPEVKAAR